MWLSRLTPADQEAAFAYIESLVEQDGKVKTSSWMPGPVWTGTPLQALYSSGTHRSKQQAGWCFGLMLMQVMIRHRDQWFCKKDPEVAGGTIYWKKR